MRVGAGNRRDLTRLQHEVIRCRKCPLLTRYRQQVAAVKVRRYRPPLLSVRRVPQPAREGERSGMSGFPRIFRTEPISSAQPTGFCSVMFTPSRLSDWQSSVSSP